MAKEVAPTKPLPSLTTEEYFAISRQLEQYHAVFYRVWEMGKPMFTYSIERAAVVFDKKGNLLSFIFNPDFWESLSPTERLFVICHEALHIVLEHGKRAKDADDSMRSALNVAMDLVINHALINRFGFSRKEIDPYGQYCWIDTVFKDRNPDNIPDDESFFYYYNRLDVGAITTGVTGGILVDEHMFSESMSDLIPLLNDELTPEEKSGLQGLIEKNTPQNQTDASEGKSRGTEAGNSWTFVDNEPVKKKRKWETVIKVWSRKFLKQEFDTFEHWAQVNRRWVLLPSDVILPTEMELQEKEDHGKVQVYFFLDTSGSCAGLSARFWNATKSLPEQRFDKRLFCFDTQVYDVDEKIGKLYGFGGTRFDVLEHRIQQIMKYEQTKYPEAVFVLTDGYGNQVQPQRVERWHWFLTERSATHCIPKGCHVHPLKDYE